MMAQNNARRPIDREIEGETVEAHGVMVTPFASVRGHAGAGGDESGAWRYEWAVIRPTRMSARDATGQTTEVRLASVEATALAAMATAGMLVAAAAALIMALSRKR